MAAIRLGMIAGRSVLVVDEHAIDIEKRSGGQFSADPMKIYEQWDTFSDWAVKQVLKGDESPVADTNFQCPVPRPSAVYAIGLNYTDHAEEAKLDIPKQPMVFTKFPSCIAGPTAEIPLTSNRVDWEAELVIVIGRGGRNIAESDAQKHIAGFTAGQDISDRRQQFSDRPPQFSLGKSSKNYGPIGPVVVTADAFDDQDAIPFSCELDGEQVQSGNTAKLIFSVSQIVSFLSKWTELNPGDLIFTGTPAGVGSVRDPRRYLTEGETITTTVPGIGTMTNKCVAQ
ncbi:fumarylacetoacetate hydrolase family protein [Cocleimonas sp. KMM 6892]|uniref:fumarylacetoacetate hydrolase family protein n=1 Tax=unclassified Cocleimonas TaxID=2639732 RepID=UPI002DBA05E1|nr:MULTISPECIES: fumarylacetoacetate hydrolase family protein [unclassified Cocleimonas]MEB8433863.1 fumarylacetoacetate hydrolase family protein [Cocleimonas sp. KMM 6892]MEC4716674.1 fumarylacetoacetate hydrolase family protein [Cocleimonas sp. KMM 6895]MEC4746171.1 fumarylacetoacetate hydrolase family protein [Cocleimonas sp. KMM 6896]